MFCLFADGMKMWMRRCFDMNFPSMLQSRILDWRCLLMFTDNKDNKAFGSGSVDEPEQRRRPDYECRSQVLEETKSLRYQLSEVNSKIADLENMAKAWQAQESLNQQVSRGKKEEDDGKDKEIERLEGELGVRNSLTDQQSVREKLIKLLEFRIKTKDDERRLLKHELAMKDEEIQRLKSQLDRKEKEYAKLKNTNMENADASPGNAFKFRAKNPPGKGYTDISYYHDLIGATNSSAGD
ncbi:hypothetical protein SADUNF_Sadunf12G0093300 [Salix dunnii]|uniref:Uncharacterized protein n=1 Tax=Salix dunnii TaxID=1413687 RepID=A0A835MPP5_9ROSI|nr:hypothetical protein SADUNF_Sadunf12G0093300 [Salix dunnii]